MTKRELSNLQKGGFFNNEPSSRDIIAELERLLRERDAERFNWLKNDIERKITIILWVSIVSLLVGMGSLILSLFFKFFG